MTAIPRASARTASTRSARRASACALRFLALLTLLLSVLATAPALAQQPHAGGEASLVLPALDQATFLGGIDGRSLLMFGLIVAALGLVFGLVIYKQLQNMPVHPS